jgi:hypothetical protein
VRRNFSIREKAAKIREKMTWHSIVSFVSVAGLRSFIGQKAVALAESEAPSVLAVGQQAVSTVTKSFAGLGGLKRLDDLGRD